MRPYGCETDLCVYFCLVLSTTCALHHAAGVRHSARVSPAVTPVPVSVAVSTTAAELHHGLKSIYYCYNIEFKKRITNNNYNFFGHLDMLDH